MSVAACGAAGGLGCGASSADSNASRAPVRRSRGSAAAAAALVLCFAAPGGVRAFTPWAEHSFSGAFRTFDSDGMRKLEHWRLGGHAVLMEHYLRLTNDRQSKRASVWNTQPLGHDEWSTTLRFRVSGQVRVGVGVSPSLPLPCLPLAWAQLPGACHSVRASG